MYLALLKSSGISAAQTLLVGDALRDLQAAHAAGLPALLVRTGKGMVTERDPRLPAVAVFDDLRAAAHAIVDGSVPTGEIV
jgi:D-glycero-D-manno-heptose 1,7-bisphosphate phosphatase